MAEIPDLSYEEVGILCEKYFGVKPVKVSNLGSCQDANFKVVDAANRPFVMKFGHIATTKQELVFQNEVIVYLNNSKACSSWLFPLPQEKISPSASSSSNDDVYIAEIEINGATYLTRLLSYVRGEVLSNFKHFSGEALSSFGSVIATMNKSLSTFTSPYMDRPGIQWDLRNANTIIDQFIYSVTEEQRVELRTAETTCTQIISQYKHEFRTQVVHGDMANYNVIAKTLPNGRPEVHGVIDFGDTSHQWLVSDVAVAIVSGFASIEVELDNPDQINYSALLDACHLVQGFHSVMPLLECEIIALWPLIVLRSISAIVSIQHELVKNPKNEYNIHEIEVDWRIYNRIKQIPIVVAQEALLACVGANALSRHKRVMLPHFAVSNMLTAYREGSSNLDPQVVDFKVINLTATSQILKYGNWKNTNDTRKAIEDFIKEETCFYSPSTRSAKQVFVAPYGLPRLYRTKVNSLVEPLTTSLSVDIIGSVGTPVYSPFNCEVFSGYRNGTCTYLLLRHRDMDIILRGISCRPDLKPSSEFVTKNCKMGSDSLLYIGKVDNGDIVGNIFDINESDDSLQECDDDNDIDRFLPSHVSVQVCFSREVTVRRYSSAAMAPAMMRIFSDPSYLIGDKSPNESDSSIDIADGMNLVRSRDRALAARRTFVAAVQEHYYRVPPQIERGYQQYLYDVSGRCYVDMVNNVAIVGHSHINLFRAATNQMHLLNTNSRFIYDKLGSFAEKIISKIPSNARDKLNVVMFVNSGSEATDLAMRVARTVVTERRRKLESSVDSSNSNTNTNSDANNSNQIRRETICLEGAYHGITTASDEISTTLNDNPRSRESRPQWINLVPMPNAFRFENEVLPQLKQRAAEQSANDASISIYSKDIVDYYGDFVTAKIRDLVAKGTPPSCFIAEPLSGNAGGVELPYGYLKRVYEEVRSAGGLCIADEVQVGYGRLGTHFWGFEEHDVIPDLLTMAKAAGNGHPLGFVVTSKEIAAEFGADGSLFSSAGGGPVSCAIGAAVIEILEKEELQKNALDVGAYLHGKLQELKNKHTNIVGCIHGHGLYQGIELTRKVKQSTTAGQISTAEYKYVPATKEAYAICERLLELGIICHNTGDYSNVLKVKPPLCISKKDADFIIKALDFCFQGW